VWLQSQRGAAYARALDRLVASHKAYPCGCTRQAIDARLLEMGVPPVRGRERVYPGTCRDGLHGKPARAWRLRVEPIRIDWHDRRLGASSEQVDEAVGDFVLRRADGPWAYQLAVVVDDAEQGVTDVVRGEDLADNTARQILLQRLLGVPTPRYLHLPLVRDARGEKLGKSTGATALALGGEAQTLRALRDAARVLALPAIEASSIADFLGAGVAAWKHRYAAPSSNSGAGPSASLGASEAPP
jgi:glutamyl-Q tRNA(Asp) synthetase